MDDTVSRLLALLPDLSPTDSHWNDTTVTLIFAPVCAGTIERSWPDIYRLAAECGCEVRFEWTDRLTSTTVLDSASGAPTFSTEHDSQIELRLTRRPAVQAEEVA